MRGFSLIDKNKVYLCNIKRKQIIMEWIEIKIQEPSIEGKYVVKTVSMMGNIKTLECHCNITNNKAHFAITNQKVTHWLK